MNSSFSHKKSPKIFRNLRLINPDKKVVYCKKCVLSNQRPRTMFNEEGICAPCLYAEFKKTGHTNAYFPLFITKSFLAKEAEHVK